MTITYQDRSDVALRVKSPLERAFALTFVKQYDTLCVSKDGTPRESIDPGIRREDSHWTKRSTYETNEETNPPFRSRISDRLGVPVQAGEPNRRAD